MINFENFVKKNNSRKIDLCIDYIKSVKYVDKIVIGFDNLKHFYIYNENILLKKLIYFMSLGGNGVGTISSLGSDFYFYLWNTITSPHNILMTYFSTLGFWLIPIIIFFNRFSKKNFFYKKILLIILLNLIIFSFWNQIWHIDLLFVLIISLIMNEGLKSETK